MPSFVITNAQYTQRHLDNEINTQESDILNNVDHEMSRVDQANAAGIAAKSVTVQTPKSSKTKQAASVVKVYLHRCLIQ